MDNKFTREDIGKIIRLELDYHQIDADDLARMESQIREGMSNSSRELDFTRAKSSTIGRIVGITNLDVKIDVLPEITEEMKKRLNLPNGIIIEVPYNQIINFEYLQE